MHFSYVANFPLQAMIDLLIPGETPGIKGPIVDNYGNVEILFFGPDEGTADLMDWAACECSLISWLPLPRV